jgi:hypothetical protein
VTEKLVVFSNRGPPIVVYCFAEIPRNRPSRCLQIESLIDRCDVSHKNLTSPF